MSARLQQAPAQYSKGSEQEFRNEMERRDAEAHKKGRDIEVGDGVRVILTDTVTKTRYGLTVASGVLTLTAV
jgi:hypothetical protein